MYLQKIYNVNVFDLMIENSFSIFINQVALGNWI